MRSALEAVEPVDRGAISVSMGEAAYLEKSPFVQGFIAGLKGFLLGAPSGAVVQAIRGKSPLVGAAIGGIGTGLISGFAKATQQKLENVAKEEAMRYHIENMKAREPFVFMPPPPTLYHALTRLRGAPPRAD